MNAASPARAKMDRHAVQDAAYDRAAAEHGAAIERLSRAYEADPDRRADLLQEIHIGLWRSFAQFDGRCSERTWVYRVAHNVAASHVRAQRRARTRNLGTLDEIATRPDPAQTNPEAETSDRQALDRLTALVRALAEPDRQIVVLYLEGLEASVIGEVCGLTPGAVATKIHRLKAVLAKQFNQGGSGEA